MKNHSRETKHVGGNRGGTRQNSDEIEKVPNVMNIERGSIENYSNNMLASLFIFTEIFEQ